MFVLLFLIKFSLAIGSVFSVIVDPDLYFKQGFGFGIDTAKNRRKKKTGKTHYLYTELNFIKKIPVHFQRKIVFLSRFHIFCKINTGNVSVKKRSDPDPDPNKSVNINKRGSGSASNWFRYSISRLCSCTVYCTVYSILLFLYCIYNASLSP